MIYINTTLITNLETHVSLIIFIRDVVFMMKRRIRIMPRRYIVGRTSKNAEMWQYVYTVYGK